MEMDGVRLPKQMEIHCACHTSHRLLREHAAQCTSCSWLVPGATEPPSQGKELQVHISKRAGAQCHPESEPELLIHQGK